MGALRESGGTRVRATQMSGVSRLCKAVSPSNDLSRRDVHDWLRIAIEGRISRVSHDAYDLAGGFFELRTNALADNDALV